MTFKRLITANLAYYSEAYDAIVFSTKWKKYEPIFAIIMILFSLFLYYSDKGNKLGIVPFVFCALGIYEFFKFYYTKRRWIKERLQSKINNELIELEISDNLIKHSGPFSKGEMNWATIKKIQKTQRGLLLKLETDVSLYLPYSIFSNQAEIDFIMSKKHESKTI